MTLLSCFSCSAALQCLPLVLQCQSARCRPVGVLSVQQRQLALGARAVVQAVVSDCRGLAFGNRHCACPGDGPPSPQPAHAATRAAEQNLHPQAQPCTVDQWLRRLVGMSPTLVLTHGTATHQLGMPAS